MADTRTTQVAYLPCEGGYLVGWVAIGAANGHIWRALSGNTPSAWGDAGQRFLAATRYRRRRRSISAAPPRTRARVAPESEPLPAARHEHLPWSAELAALGV